jgi:hypothetical protein
MTRLYRPVGLNELALIWDSGCREFPPRLPEQPIFYPVTSAEYATQIARDWNTKSSSYAGYVTSFDVDDNYLSKFERHVVGSAIHEEYWIPASELGKFNRSIRGRISVDDAYFGDSFTGFIPEKARLRGKKAQEQFVNLALSRDFDGIDFAAEVSVNRKAIYLNCLFWLQQDFMADGLDQSNKRATLRGLIEAWKRSGIEPELPSAFTNCVSKQ